MALFPQIGPAYYDEKHKGILERMESFYSESISINQSFWAEADTDTRFEAGDQTVWSDLYGNVPVNRRRQFNFNRIRRVKNMIGGHQRRNRKSTIVVPVENGDELTADQFTKVMMWINDQDGVLDTISNAFDGALVTGMNLLQVWVDYRSDPVSGNVRVNNCSYNSFLIDPFFRKQDLSDCKGLWKRSFLTKSECLSLLPDYKEEIIGLQGNDMRDNKFQYMPENYNYGPKNLLTYDEFYYRDYRTQKMLVDTQTGETMEWKSEDHDALREYLRVYPQVTTIDQEVPTVRVAIVVQGKVLYDGPNPIGIDSYPFVPVLAYYTPQLPYFPWRVQGVVRGLRDAQYLYNRRKVVELDILESQINSGWKYKENALVNPEDVFLSGQGKGLALKEEALMSDVEKIPSAGIDPSMIQLSELLAREVQEISGVNEELLGAADDDKAGVLAMLRQGAGLTTLQILFDQLDRSQKLLGKLMIDIVQSNFTPGKVQRIIEEEPSAQFYNKAFGMYDAAVEEGLNTTTQKQMQFIQLMKMRELGIGIPDKTILEASTIQNKKDLIDQLEQAEQQKAQMEQAQFEMEMREREAQIKLVDARAIADKGLGLERASRVEENEAFATERYAEAQKDRAIGDLNIVKAMKEVEDVDLSQLEKLIQLSRVVSLQNVVDEKRQTAAKDSTMAGAARVAKGAVPNEQVMQT